MYWHASVPVDPLVHTRMLSYNSICIRAILLLLTFLLHPCLYPVYFAILIPEWCDDFLVFLTQYLCVWASKQSPAQRLHSSHHRSQPPVTIWVASSLVLML